MNSRTYIAKRVASELKDGQVVNLGIGIPTMVPKFIGKEANVIFQSENGVLKIGPAPMSMADFNPNIYDAGGAFATISPGGAFLNSADAFGLIRSGRVDVTVLGAVQVDEKGNLANWHIPNKMLVGFGGAMDLVTCAKKVVVAMEHTAKGNMKIMKECTFPLTGANCVDEIVTEMGVFDVTEKGLVLKEIAENTTVEKIREKTEADFIVAEKLKINKLS